MLFIGHKAKEGNSFHEVYRNESLCCTMYLRRHTLYLSRLYILYYLYIKLSGIFHQDPDSAKYQKKKKEG